MTDRLLTTFDPWAAIAAEEHKSTFESPSASDIQGMSTDLIIKSMEHLEGSDLNVWKTMGFVYSVGGVIYSYEADVRWVQDGFGMTEYEAQSVGLEIATTRGAAGAVGAAIWGGLLGVLTLGNPVAVIAGGVGGELWAVDLYDNWVGGFKERLDHSTAGFYALMPAIAEELEAIDGDNEYSFESLLESHTFTMDDDGTEYEYSYVASTDSPDTFDHDGETFFYFAEGGEDHIISYDGITVTGGVAVDLTTGEGHISGEATDYFNGAVKDVIGSDYADSISGDGQANALNGGGGNDTITASIGDTLTGDTGDDTFKLIFGGTGTTSVTDFALGDDALDLTAFGAFGYNLQADATESGGTTTLHINGHDIVVTGVTKTDLFNPSNNAFIGLIGGTAGNDLIGNSSANTINTGSPDINSLYATANNDTLTGNGNNDTLNGGAGNDTYVFAKGDGADTISESYGTEKNILRMTNVSASELFLNSATYPYTGLVATAHDGSAQGSVTITSQFVNAGSSQYVLRYLQLSDRVLDLAGPLVYSTPVTTGATVISQQAVAVADTVLGAAGNDYLLAGSGANTLNGFGGNDQMYGLAGADSITGGTGNDTMSGGAGNDTYYFNKGDGADRIEETQESAGNNVLHLNSINLADIYLTSSAMVWGNYSLLVTINDGSAQGSVEIVNQWYSTPGTNGYMMKTIEAADGSIDLTTTSGLTYRTLPTTAGSAIARPDLGMNNTVQGGTGNDYLLGGPGADSIVAAGGADSIIGNAGADSITGGTGNDTMSGGAGNDTYYFSKGDGTDRIEETQESAGNNVLHLNSINLADIYLTSSATVWGNYSLLVTINDGSAQGSVEIYNQWYSTPASNGYMVKTIEAADGNIDLTTTSGLTYRTLPTTAGSAIARPDLGMNNTVQGGTGNDYLLGGPGADSISGSSGADSIIAQAGADSITGGTGNDTMSGGAGNDTYYFSKGDGTDRIEETQESAGNNVLHLNSINLADIYLTSSATVWGNYSLLVTINDGSAQGSVEIYNQWYTTPATNGYMVKTIEAADGSIDLTTTSGLTYRTLPTTAGGANARPDLGMNNTVQGGTGNDGLSGGPGADSLSGFGGSDAIYGNAGADTLIGGLGNDTMYGGDGDDTYVVGTTDGQDYIYDYSGSNSLDIGVYDHYTNSGNDRTYYFDGTNTHWVFIDEFGANSWSVI